MNDSSAVLCAKEDISVLNRDVIGRLKIMALNAPLKRARFCLHLSHGDAVQEMVIALHKDSYIRPHRHQHKTESFHMIEGAVLVAFFNEEGEIEQRVHLSAASEAPFLYRLSVSKWHSVLPLSEFAVFHEVATGPFSPSEYPSWEPENRSDAIEEFRNSMLGSM